MTNLDKLRAEVEQLPTKTRTNWDGCCPDIDYPEIEYVDVTKKQLLDIIDKYKGEIGDERYKGQLYFDCKNGVYGVNTSSDRTGKFFPFPYKLKNGNVDWKEFKKHWKDVYEFVGEILKKGEEESEDQRGINDNKY